MAGQTGSLPGSAERPRRRSQDKLPVCPTLAPRFSSLQGVATRHYERKRSIQLFPNRYLRRPDKHIGAVLSEGLDVRRFGMLIQSSHARPVFIGDELSGLLDRLMKFVVDAGRFGSCGGD